MKIMIVTPYFYPKIGGAESYALNIAKGLQKKGYEVFVVTSNHKSKKRVDENVQGLRVIRLPRLLKLSNTPINPLWGWQLKKIIKSEKPSIINAHTPVPGLADMAFLARSKTKFVVTYHAGSMKKGNSSVDFLLEIYERTFLTHMLKKSDKVISVYPEFVKSLLNDASKRIYFIPPGVDSRLFHPSPISRSRVPLVLFVGRIERSSSGKGIATLMQAMVGVLAKEPTTLLKLVGDGDAVADYKDLAQKLGIENNVEFTGILQDKKLVEAYQAAHLLVLPSEISESFGMVLIEAMACGTPVVATDIGGMTDTVKSTGGGLLAAPNNSTDLAKKIIKLLVNPQLSHEFAQSGRNNVIANYSWENAVQLYYEACRSLVEKKVQRIAHVSPTYPPHLGGMEQRVQDLSRRLSGYSHNVRVLTSDQGTYAHEVIENSLTVQYLKSWTIMKTPVIPSLFWQILKQPKGTIIHIHIAQALTPEMAFLAAKMRGLPTVVHIRGDVQPSTSMGKVLLPIYKNIFLKYVLRHTDRVIVLTRDYSEMINKRYGVPKSNISVIPNATNFVIRKASKRPPSSRTKLLLVGRLSIQKNIELAIRGVALLKKDNISVTLSIVGDGELYVKLAGLAKTLNIDDQIIFCGRLEGKKLERAYIESDIVIQPSFDEGFSTVLLEAMAIGKPIIAGNILGTRSIIRDGYNGLLISPYSIDSLVSALCKLIKDSSLRHKLVTNGFKELKNYSWDEITKKTEQVYEEVHA